MSVSRAGIAPSRKTRTPLPRGESRIENGGKTRRFTTTSRARFVNVVSQSAAGRIGSARLLNISAKVDAALRQKRDEGAHERRGDSPVAVRTTGGQWDRPRTAGDDKITTGTSTTTRLECITN